jgi:hypothetical protein
VKSELVNLITTVDREENVDRRSGPREFVDSEIREKEKALMKVLKYGIVKRAGPWS